MCGTCPTAVLALTAGASCRWRQGRRSIGPSQHPLRRGVPAAGETCGPAPGWRTKVSLLRTTASISAFELLPSAAASPGRRPSEFVLMPLPATGRYTNSLVRRRRPPRAGIDGCPHRLRSAARGRARTGRTAPSVIPRSQRRRPHMSSLSREQIDALCRLMDERWNREVSEIRSVVERSGTTACRNHSRGGRRIGWTRP